VPIVFVTALITPEEARDGRRIEGHRVVAKPTNSSELINVVEENLPRWYCSLKPDIAENLQIFGRTPPSKMPGLTERLRHYTNQIERKNYG